MCVNVGMNDFAGMPNRLLRFKAAKEASWLVRFLNFLINFSLAFTIELVKWKNSEIKVSGFALAGSSLFLQSK